MANGRLRENIFRARLRYILKIHASFLAGLRYFVCDICLNKKLVRSPRSRRCLQMRPRNFRETQKKSPTFRTGTKVGILHPLFKGETILESKNERPKINIEIPNLIPPIFLNPLVHSVEKEIAFSILRDSLALCRSIC